MKTIVLMVLLLGSSAFLKAQYPPAAGQLGSTAVHADSSCFVRWAINCVVERGFVNMSDTTIEAGGSNYASYGSSSDALGSPDNMVVSLGDQGTALFTFEYPLVNGPGWDFAVFENALTDTFLELAFVEVSSNGTNFFRFPSVSLTQTDIQTGSFGETDPTKIHNLAGKYRSMYGVPFNLDDIPDDTLLNKNAIIYVKIIDVGGSVNPFFASFDNLGNKINDPFPTPFNSSGFDLDAIGVINDTQTNLLDFVKAECRIFPNPTSDILCLQTEDGGPKNIIIYNAQGQSICFANLTENCIDVSMLAAGIYSVMIITQTQMTHQLLFINE